MIITIVTATIITNIRIMTGTIMAGEKRIARAGCSARRGD